MKKIKKLILSEVSRLNNSEMQSTLGGVYSNATACSADCPKGQSAEISGCIGTCIGDSGFAVCSGSTAILTKYCHDDE